jgi:3-hydroxyisobutyrate dehydrogenase
MSKVAFLGTGLLGSGMIARLLHNGESVAVWNRTAAKAQALEPLGASVAVTPAAAVAGAARVHMALADDRAVDSVLGDIVERLAADTVIVDHTTTSPVGAADRQARLAARGVKYLHAPVFMSPEFARTGQGLMLVSGPAPVFAEVREALQGMTGEAWFLGEERGRAAAFKLFGNVMIFAITAGVADIISLAGSLGIPATDALQVFSKFQPVGVIKGRGDKMAREDFAASFELTMARKDARLMIETAGDRPLAILPAIAQRMDEAIALGHGQDDLAAVIKALTAPAAVRDR